MSTPMSKADREFVFFYKHCTNHHPASCTVENVRKWRAEDAEEENQRNAFEKALREFGDLDFQLRMAELSKKK